MKLLISEQFGDMFREFGVNNCIYSNFTVYICGSTVFKNENKDQRLKRTKQDSILRSDKYGTSSSS